MQTEFKKKKKHKKARSSRGQDLEKLTWSRTLSTLLCQLLDPSLIWIGVLFSRLHAWPFRSLQGLLCAVSRVRVCVPVHSSAKQFHAAAEFKGRRQSHFHRNNFYFLYFLHCTLELYFRKKKRKSLHLWSLLLEVLAVWSASGDPSIVCSVIFSWLHPDFRAEAIHCGSSFRLCC
jgi:hypothetical protein